MSAPFSYYGSSETQNRRPNAEKGTKMGKGALEARLASSRTGSCIVTPLPFLVPEDPLGSCLASELEPPATTALRAAPPHSLLRNSLFD